ncbi:ATP synthase subunit s, mitochondrial [Drosophila novamexicana]|uniref:ATP synthase subunit s, mitochondrial n=1 Tax=Drosophila novamexicana TaxID=47314 RepID=UPI0011E5D65D|nr:ATP synthase subunit s, mitochondrial [Drosophila novamexicana]
MSLLHTVIKSLSKRLILQGAGVQQNYLRIAAKPHHADSRTFATPTRSIWGYVAVAFNQVDADRLAKVGPNRLCAEWVVKNGGGVRFTESPTKLWKDYNQLPSENTAFRIKVVDASNASVMKIGLEHLKGCDHIDTVIFHNCKHLENEGLNGLSHISKSLTRLQVSGCYNISDSGLAIISELHNLKQLLIFDMIYVKNMEEVARSLKSSLPECDIQATKFAVQLKKNK